MLKVKEFNMFWRQLYEMLDEGIITAIKIENDATQGVIKRISEHMVEQHSSGLFVPMDDSDFRIPYLDLESEIQRIDFTGAEVSLYMQGIEYPEHPLKDIRLKDGMLEMLYDSFRYHAYEELIDAQTFIHQLVLAFQNDALPLRWRYFDFQVFNKMIQRFRATPLGSNDNKMYSESVTPSRDFVDWKKLFTMFTLLMAPLPTRSTITEYQAALTKVANE